MTENEFETGVRLLYHIVLGREGDPPGIRHFVSGIQNSGDIAPAELLKVARIMLESPEYSIAVSGNRGHPKGLEFVNACLFCESASFLSAPTLNDAEFKVYSQSGEDGILQWLLRRIENPVKSFIEFGVENYTESNTRFLHLKDHYRGLVIDARKENIDYINADPDLRDSLIAHCAFIDRDNINAIFKQHGFAGEIGILSIDIDGNDYWIWEAIHSVTPQIVICEYNSAFGYEKACAIAYDPMHIWEYTAYFGASLSAFCHLADQKGYRLVGVNSLQFNAFFVRKDLMGGFSALSPGEIQKRRSFSHGNLADIRDRMICDVLTGRLDTVGAMLCGE